MGNSYLFMFAVLIHIYTYLLAACLCLQHGPTRNWNCPYCSEKIVPARKVTGKSKPFSVRRVVKAPEHVGGGCVLCR